MLEQVAAAAAVLAAISSVIAAYRSSSRRSLARVRYLAETLSALPASHVELSAHLIIELGAEGKRYLDLSRRKAARMDRRLDRLFYGFIAVAFVTFTLVTPQMSSTQYISAAMLGLNVALVWRFRPDSVDRRLSSFLRRHV